MVWSWTSSPTLQCIQIKGEGGKGDSRTADAVGGPACAGEHSASQLGTRPAAEGEVKTGEVLGTRPAAEGEAACPDEVGERTARLPVRAEVAARPSDET